MAAMTQHYVAELYQGEVLGEALFNRMLSDLDDTRQRHVVASMLQLETETKARLRQAVAERGLPLAEDEAQRSAGVEVGVSLAAMTWLDKMRRLEVGIGSVYLPRVREIAAVAEPEDEAITSYMVTHEVALLEVVQNELAGNLSGSLDSVDAQLRFPLQASHRPCVIPQDT